MRIFGFSRIMIILIMTALTACDTYSILLVNDVVSYSKSLKCGTIKITGRTLFEDNVPIDRERYI